MLVDDAGTSGRTVLGTNALGGVRVTHAMLPLLRRAASPRIVDAARPRHVATDLTGHASSRTPEQCAASTPISAGPDDRC